MDICVISDVHLGTYGCQAKELVHYLKSIDPEILILNGDIFDIWQFKKRYFPKKHFEVISLLMKFISKGKRVIYLTGNHDETLRKFSGMNLGGLELLNKIVLDINGQKHWFFHGDVFDVTMQHSKWLAKLGGIGYDILILINSAVNWCMERMGKEKISLSKKVKNSVKGAVKFINNFERTAAEIAIEKGYHRVVCGHIHHPEIRTVTTEKGSVVYMNSGDWVENRTSLEYYKNRWSVFQYHPKDFQNEKSNTLEDKAHKKTKALFQEMAKEFKSPTEA